MIVTQTFIKFKMEFKKNSGLAVASATQGQATGLPTAPYGVTLPDGSEISASS